MREFIIKGAVNETEAPPELTDFLQDIWCGKGGIIRIDPSARPAKVMWAMKQLLRLTAIGFQWNMVAKLKEQGMHHEQAEAHVTTMINTLIGAEVPAIPSHVNLAELHEDSDDVEQRSDNQVPE